MLDELDLYHRPDRAVHLFVDRDLRDSKKTDFYSWVEAALGVSRDVLDEWTIKIGEMKWFEDTVIQRCLKEYCNAREQDARYAPFTQLVNRIITLARRNLPGICDTNPYPIDSIQFVDTSSHLVSGIAERRHLSPSCQLYVTLTNGTAAKRFRQVGKMDWVDVLHWVELTYVNDLGDALEHEKTSRKVSMSITSNM